ncbi:MAG TPA: HAD family phosphatase [Burkholderiaceae bacterium]
MNIVFDFGGVLFHWHPASFLARLWPQRDGAESAAQFFQAYGGDWGAFDQGLIDAPTVIERIAARTGWPQGEVAHVVAAVPGELRLLDDTAALIEELKGAGHRLFFLSNMPEPFADHLERQHPLDRWFEAGVFSSRVKVSKPSPEMFALAAARFGVPAGELLLLDDHPANVEAARASGWQALLFTTAAAARPQLKELLR